MDEHPVWSQGVVSVLALEKVIVLSPVKWHNYGGLDKFDFIKGKDFIGKQPFKTKQKRCRL